MAWYSGATRKNIPPGPNDPPIKPRVVILHVAATEATSLFSYFSTGSGGVESHFYIRYDGSVEQYRDTDRQADANVMANDFAISIETQGLADGTWTAAQLASIKALLSWCHNTHGIPLVVCPKWDGSGVGYHILFEAQWDQRGASCPGPNRIQQFKNVLVPWMASGGSEDDVSPDDIKAIAKAVADEVWTRPVEDLDRKETTTGAAQGLILRNSTAAVREGRAGREDLLAAVKAGQQAGPAADADAIVDALANRLNLKEPQ